jgi:hypothetical protein
MEEKIKEFRKKYESECLYETKIGGGSEVGIDLDAWEMETWFEEYLTEALRQRDEEIEKYIKMRREGITGLNQDYTSGMARAYANILEYLQTLKHVKNTSNTCKHLT